MTSSPIQPLRYDNSVVFITGGGSGIGMGLAAAFHSRGAKVIIGGRRRSKLEAVASRHPGIETLEIDVANPISVDECVKQLVAQHPNLNVVINNAGVQQLVDFTVDEQLSASALGEEIDINLKGLIYVTAAVLPILKQQPRARLINISSGMCYIPRTSAPIYAATKAAVHSFTLSLRYQFKGSSVEIIEIIPPLVETDLHVSQRSKPPAIAMTLDAFVSAAMKGLDAGRPEIAVGLVRVLRPAARIAPRLFLKLVNRL